MANKWGIPREVEELVRQRDLFCIYCGSPFNGVIHTHKTRPTWEHIINDIRINGAENIALCCGSCNASKGAKLLEEWLSGNYCSKKGITADSLAPVVKEYLSRLEGR